MPATTILRSTRRMARGMAAAALLSLGMTAGCTPNDGLVGTPGAGTPEGATAPPGATAAVTVVRSSGPTLSPPDALGTQRATGKVPTYVRSFGGFGNGDGQLQLPTGIAVDTAGNV